LGCGFRTAASSGQRRVGRQPHVDVHGIKRTHDATAAGTLQQTEFGQNFDIVMDPSDVARYPSRKRANRRTW
jgi:hypothetical protein